MVNVRQPDSYIPAAVNDAMTCELLLPKYRVVAASVCFHAEQCSEKLLKQVFVDNGRTPPRSHALTDILHDAYEAGFLAKDERLERASVYLK